jgi:hypothetical protein
VNDGTLLFFNFAAYSIVLVIPVAFAKAWELKKSLPLSIGRAAAVGGLANLASTVLCVLAVFAAGWVLGLLDFIAQPQAGEGDLAAVAALLPCFFLSTWADTKVGGLLLPRLPRPDVRAALVRANQLGYAMIGIVPIVRFVKSLVVNGRIIW